MKLLAATPVTDSDERKSQLPYQKIMSCYPLTACLMIHKMMMKKMRWLPE